MKSVLYIRNRVLLTMLVALSGVFLFSAKVSADLIWEPMDSFYETHRNSCEYINRAFTTNGPDDKVIVYESPVSDKEITVLDNGMELYVSYVYTDADGMKWGIYEASYDDQAVTGWFPLDYVTVIYDYISFEEDFGEQFVAEEGQVDASYLGQEIFYWEYPGSTKSGTLKLFGEHTPGYSQVYVDELGHKWGFMGYYYGLKRKWICLDDPTADYETLYPEGAAVQELIAGTTEDEARVQEDADVVKDTADAEKGSTNSVQDTDNEAERIVPKDSAGGYMGIAAVLVAAVVAVTAVLLKKLKKQAT